MQPILLKCYLGKGGDAQNMLVLYDRILVVIFKGKRVDFPLSSIKGLVISRKKLIIPLVIGGIGTCFSWLALSLGWYHYQTNLLLVFLFFGWMYYGFIGKDGLELLEGKDRHVFLIKANHFVLNTFLKFTKARMYQAPAQRESISFHLSSKKDWEAQGQSTLYKHPSLESEGFIHTSYLSELRTTYEQYFKPDDQLVLLGIDLSKVEAEVKINEVPSRGTLFPHIYGKLNKSAIVFLRAIESAQDLDFKTIE
ncbi:Uncharacterized conserved protein, DUF952 family [Reichenbachiella faecimaris]|uniref:Uncharacterized conserved protein, DUF952 family n=1 Tax=Reichenbachiella faecimaris TaxID=692418 RepID=A0A1W2GP76_REIFA|nr:DUF952 domain-containing protein [Reichenbachiella faecimaris]SMD38252.1 Uncharacterized conserved protein, DUF952 family [Reichenbachiella faecimaris]